MGNRIEQVANTSNLRRLIVEELDGGMSTRTSPEKIANNRLEFVKNGVYFQDGTILKRSGNQSIGTLGTGQPWYAMGYLLNANPSAGSQILVKSNNAIYAATENVWAWSKISPLTANPFSNGPMTFTQAYDPDFAPGAAQITIMCDGTNVPYGWDGTNFIPLTAGTIPNKRNGVPGNEITPQFVLTWGPHIVYAGEPTEPTGLYISDALRPERFTGFGFVDSQGTGYYPYFPAGRDGIHGAIQAIACINELLIIFFANAIVACVNTGSYGAMNYQFKYLSRSVGTVAGASVVAMDEYIIFYSGNRFFATDGYNIWPLPDELPTYYSWELQAWYQPQFGVGSPTQVSAVRYGDQYWACTGGGNTILVFDTTANGGFVPGQQTEERPDVQATGGAWSTFAGMTTQCGVFLPVGFGGLPRLYWGSGSQDKGYQYGIAFNDDSNPIAFEVRSRAWYMGAPNAPATVQSVTVKAAYPQNTASFTSQPTLYATVDRTEYDCPQSNIVVPTTPAYVPSEVVPIQIPGSPNAVVQGYAVQVGVKENSTHGFGVMSLSAEVSVDEPRPTF